MITKWFECQKRKTKWFVLFEVYLFGSIILCCIRKDKYILFLIFFRNPETLWNGTSKYIGTKIFRSTKQTETGSKTVFITLLSSKKKRLKKKIFELKSKKEKIVTENLKKKKIVTEAQSKPTQKHPEKFLKPPLLPRPLSIFLLC